METNGCARSIVAFVRQQRGRRVWIVTHEAPDGDAIGSLLAMSHLVRECGGVPLALCADPVPAVYTFLPGADSIVSAPMRDGDEPGAQVQLPPEAVIFVDCGTRERVGPLQELLKANVPEANVDHHPSNTRFAATVNWVDPKSSSTGEMMAQLYDEAGVALEGAADALYAAVVTDTGSFAFASTSPATHRLAARLLEAGVNPGEQHSHIYESRDPAGLALLGRALGSLRLCAGGRIAYMVLTPDDFEATGASEEHSGGIVNYARAVRGAQVGILFHSANHEQVRIGIRTRPEVDASALAARFGGGGHARAAGCRLKPPLDQAIERVLAAASEAVL